MTSRIGAPRPISPYERLRKAAGYSRKKFAEEFEFSEQYIYDVERGIYPELSSKTINALAEVCGETAIDVTKILMDNYLTPNLPKAHQRWVTEQRKIAAEVINTVRPDQWTKRASPFAVLIERTAGSASRFGELLKLQPSTLDRYARGKQRVMPARLEGALREIGYPYLSELLANQENWRVEHRG